MLETYIIVGSSIITFSNIIPPPLRHLVFPLNPREWPLKASGDPSLGIQHALVGWPQHTFNWPQWTKSLAWAQGVVLLISSLVIPFHSNSLFLGHTHLYWLSNGFQLIVVWIMAIIFVPDFCEFHIIFSSLV